jgi:hypothetical protein
MKIDDAIHGISTLISVGIAGGSSQGTGFFYQKLEEKDPKKKDGQWRAIQNTWLVTNRHVALPVVDGQEAVPEIFAFHMRRVEKDHVVWDPILLLRAGVLLLAGNHTF